MSRSRNGSKAHHDQRTLAGLRGKKTAAKIARRAACRECQKAKGAAE